MDTSTLKSLPVGYRFRPTDEELIHYYLGLKNIGVEKEISAIREVDICKWEPWDLPDLSVIESKDNEWFFFSPKDQNYPNRKRSSRSTKAGYWKATGRERMIKTRIGAKVIGNKRTLVFYKGRARNGTRTHWVIHEYCATEKALDGAHPRQYGVFVPSCSAGRKYQFPLNGCIWTTLCQESCIVQCAFVLCRLFKKHDGNPAENSGTPNCNEIDQLGSSPTTLNSPGEDALSERVTPILVNKSEKQPTGVENFQDENSETVVSDLPLPIDSHQNLCVTDDAKNQLIPVTSNQLNPELENPPWQFHDSMSDPQYSKIFSPPHSQMQRTIGYGNFNSGPDALQSQYDSDEIDLGELSNMVELDQQLFEVSDIPTISTFENQPSINCLTLVSEDRNSLFGYPRTGHQILQMSVSDSDESFDLPNGPEDLYISTDTFGSGFTGDNFGVGIQSRTQKSQNENVAQNFSSDEENYEDEKRWVDDSTDETQEESVDNSDNDGEVTQELSLTPKPNKSVSSSVYMPMVLVVGGLFIVAIGVWGWRKF